MARSAIGRRQNIFLHNVNLMFLFIKPMRMTRGDENLLILSIVFVVLR